MPELPVSLGNLITYVKALHPGGDALQNLSDAFTVSAALDEQSDALIGHFVDQARRSGASWSQIGTSMGVSKQAAQKRFVAAWEGADFSRFTQRARNVLAAAGRAAADRPRGVIDVPQLVAGLLTEPDGIAAKVIHAAGPSDEELLAALGVAPAPGAGDEAGEADAAALRALRFTGSGRAALRDALHAALRMRHNYIGTEHLLLGILTADVAVAQTLAGLGLMTEEVQRLIAAQFTAVHAQRQARGPASGP
jgi:Clp amino terminal domain, pathogenicity island component